MRTLEEVIKALRCTDPEVDSETKCNDCPYKESHRNELWHVGPSCLDEMFSDAIHYLNAYRQLSRGFVGENTEIRPEGIYCKVCGTRLDKDWEDEDAG